MTVRRVLSLLSLLVPLTAAAAAEPQGRWLPANTPGVAGTIACMTEWDPDGPGPEPALLVVGGSFFQAGLLRANNVAAWDGEDWVPLADGVGIRGSTNYVYDLAVLNGDLYAVGEFTEASGVPARNIARFDGLQWHALDAGLDLRGFALLAFNNELIVGGDFQQVGAAVAAPYAARWNGSQWLPFPGTPLSGRVRDLIIYNNEIVAGGLFGGVAPVLNRVARFDGAAWRPFGSGVNAYVRALAVHGSDLIAAGEFTSAGGVAANRVAAWNGAAWNALGAGFSGGVAAGAASFNNELIVAGWNGSGVSTSPLVQRWNGAAWSGLPGAFVGYGGASAWVAPLLVRAGELCVGGSFWAMDRGEPYTADRIVTVSGLTKWTGQTWEAIADGGEWINVHAMEHFQGKVALGGGLIPAGVDNSVCIGGHTPPVWQQPRLLYWDGVRLSPNTAPYPVSTEEEPGHLIVSLREHANRLYVGGHSLSDTPGGGAWASDHIAYVDDTGWSLLPGGWTPEDQVVEPMISNAGVLAGSPMSCSIDSGWYEFVGQTWVHRPGLFQPRSSNGRDQPVFPFLRGSDAIQDGNITVPFLRVSDAIRDGNTTILGGQFSDTPDGLQRGAARWTGAAWEFFPFLDRPYHWYGMLNNSRMFSVALHDNQLYVGGTAWHDSGGVNGIGLVYRLDGNDWTSIAELTQFPSSWYRPGYVLDLFSYRGRLIAAGWFAELAGRPGTRSIAAWDGAAWSPLQTGASCTVKLLAQHHDELLVGGIAWGQWLTRQPFDQITFGDVYSPMFARWTDTGIPWVAYQPQPVSLAPAETATFSMNPAVGYDFDGPVQFQWRRNGVPVADGPAGASPNGGVVTGATGGLRGRRAATLTITNVQPSDAGDYDVLIWNGCGNAASQPAALAVSAPPCPGDANGDNVVNFADLNIVLSFFGQSVTPGTSGDVNNDGAVNFADLNLVLSFFGTAC